MKEFLLEKYGLIGLALLISLSANLKLWKRINLLTELSIRSKDRDIERLNFTIKELLKAQEQQLLIKYEQHANLVDSKTLISRKTKNQLE